MKRILFALMLLLSGSAAWGQPVGSPTINYQGRAQDQDGNPVTGPHQVTLRIYDAETGGAPLFAETHSPVNFSDAGIFTVVIGERTATGIPASVEFSQPRWLGVTISGFNDGNELPRLRFHGSPYSAVANRADSSRSAGVAGRATQADNADHATSADSSGVSDSANFATSAGHAETATTAESAGEVNLPATFENNDAAAPTLTIRNTEKDGIALNVEGNVQVRGGINVTQVCGTTDHFLAGTDLGNTNVPDKGGVYRDNTPIAWGQVQPDGSMIADFGISRITYTPSNPGVYLVELDNSVAVDSFTRPELAVMVTPMTQASPNAPLVFLGWDYAIDQETLLPRDDAFTVFARNITDGTPTRFSVVVFGRPGTN